MVSSGSVVMKTVSNLLAADVLHLPSSDSTSVVDTLDKVTAGGRMEAEVSIRRQTLELGFELGVVAMKTVSNLFGDRRFEQPQPTVTQ